MDRRELESELERLHSASLAWALGCCRWRREEAEEVLQESYMRILDGKAQFNAGSSFRTFLFGIIRLVSLEHWRRFVWRCRRLVSFPSDPEWLDPSQNPSLMLESKERVSRLVAALRQLPARQREILELVFYQGMSVRDASDVMRVTPGAAAVHYDRGKARLRALLTSPSKEDEMR